MKRSVLRCTWLPVLLIALVSRAVAQDVDPDWKHLIVLHTNDVHGQVLPRPATWIKDRDPLPTTGGLARVAGFVNRVRAQAKKDGSEVLLVDGGDWYQGTPEGAIGDGRPFLEAIAHIGYDAMCVGNHEFDHGVETLLGHLAAHPLPALLANVRDAEGEHLAGTRPHLVVERAGIRIGIVGLLTTSTPAITDVSTRELDWTEAEEELARVKKELADEVDWFLPITHIGVGGDRDLARAHPELDLIVGGHSHSFLRRGVTEGSTLIVQMGSKATGVGRVDVWFDPETKRVMRKEGKVVNLFEDPEETYRNRAVEASCERLIEISAKHMEEVVGELTAPLARGRRGSVSSSPCGNLVTDVMRAHVKADIAFTNRGGLRADLPAGPVTRRYLFQVLPFGNHLVTFRMKGAKILELFSRSVEGRGHAGLEFSGMTLEVKDPGGGFRLERLLVGGEPIDPKTTYSVVTNSFLAQGGDAFRELEEIAERTEDPTLLRHMMEQAFDGGELTPPKENRYVVVR
ncbi:MAG: bifunctional metallophosphatase/5'-nucleotidase [bacterium]|nr:bifunctional metallophosphatase/5'-nucleotidase [bacterium]